MHNIDLILLLSFGLGLALVLGYVTQRLGWSPIVGYLLAGIMAGPHTPGFVGNQQIADQLAEVGVILLMFGVGLHFHLKDLMAVRKIAVLGAVVQSAAATLLGLAVLQWQGVGSSAGLVFGLSLSVASTVVLTRVLADNGDLQSPTGRVAIGWLVMEDIFTIFVLVVLPVIFGKGAIKPGESLPMAFLVAALKLGGFVAFTLVAGNRAVPWLLSRVALTRSRELFTLSVLAVAMGIAVGASYFFGVSMALGAFLAGMVVGQSEFSARAAAEALPMRDAFAVMFFLSVGMLFDPAAMLQNPILILTTLGIVMIGKPLAALFIVVLLGHGTRIGLGVAVALAQIGEFSFLLAAMGRELKVLPAELMNPLVAAAIISIMLNPALYRMVPRLEWALRGRPSLWRMLNRKAAKARADVTSGTAALDSHRAVVVGYGPVGRAVVRLLRARGIDTTVIEMNFQTIQELKLAGVASVYGDANQREVLERAGMAGAEALILSSSGSAEFTEAIRVARELNPETHIAARADFLGQTAALRKAGADEVFSGEGEVALAFANSILRDLGATPEQLDEERARLRAELQRAAAGPAH